MFGGNDNGQAQQATDQIDPTAAQPADANTVQATAQPSSPPPVAPAADQSVVDSTATAEPVVQAEIEAPAVSTAQPTASTVDDLLDIKQSALQQLTPLLNHLDQSPEERFRTTMMMIQASDNDSLLKTAYEAAQQIPDEKVRAQALLDVVNEINYFTQHNGVSEQALEQ